jgi:hypothetical protein
MRNILKAEVVNFVQNVAWFCLSGWTNLIQNQLGKSFGQLELLFGILVKDGVVLFKYRLLPVDLFGICNTEPNINSIISLHPRFSINQI